MPAGSTYTPIATTTLGSSASEIVFSSISGSYTDLVLVISGTKTVATGEGIQIRVGNGSVDSGSNYSDTILSGSGSAAYSARDTNATQGRLTYYASWNNGSSYQANIIVNLMNYSNTSTYKTYISRANTAANGVDAIVGLWRSTSAINIIRVNPAGNSFDVGTTATLYGIQAA